MVDIKLKENKKGTIKTIDKVISDSQRIKKKIVETKDKINESTTKEENTSGTNYAINRVKNLNKKVADNTKKLREIKNKNINQTKEDIDIAKKDITHIKKKNHSQKVAKNMVKGANTRRNISENSLIKNVQNSNPKAIKTSKAVQQNLKNTNKASNKAFKMGKELAKKTTKRAKFTIKGAIQSIKTAVTTSKAIISLLMALGGTAVFFILIITIIGGFIANFFNGNEDTDYDFSQFPNSQIVVVAKAQIGNEGGDKFWKWYGFEEHVAWCACFVSWCANECGYIEKGIIPKFAVCDDGINWFKQKNEWHDRENYYAIAGDIIFFDWYEEDGSQDGISNHVGIVTKTDLTNRMVYTIEGNTSNKCAERFYSLDDKQIMGYGSPKY